MRPCGDQHEMCHFDVASGWFGLYHFGNGVWFGVFLVTQDGIILVDPISTDLATWLKGELTQRFPRVPVRYVIYSHSHFDHIEAWENVCCSEWWLTLAEGGFD